MKVNLQPVMNVVVAFLVALLTRAANGLWQATFAKLFEAIDQAEAKWTAEGEGKVKRDWVVAQVMIFVDEKLKSAGKPLAWLDRWLVQMAVGAIADAVVATLNDTLGHGWRAQAEELERKWAEALPVIS
jgi:hypothetical protein